MRWSERRTDVRSHLRDDFHTSITSDMRSRPPSLILFSLGLMHTDLIINAVVSLVSAFIGAWFGAKFQAKRSEKAQAELLAQLNTTSNSLSAIARRLPGGEAYVAVKQAEWRAEREMKEKQQ
jgi:membrane protein implicated in regulation of membrane protease activity